jgi:hypothetical protein
MTEQTKIHKAECTDSTHRIAGTLFQLRLDLKALAATTSEDGAIAHPSRVSINHTAFHRDALEVVCASGVSLVSKSRRQVIVCLCAIPINGANEIESALNAIQRNLEWVAYHLKARPFTNDRRIAASFICAETCDLCALAIQSFAVRHFVEINP